MTLSDPVFGDLQDVYQGLYAPKRLWQSQMRFEEFNEPVHMEFETTDELGVQTFHYQAYEDFKLYQAQYESLALESLLKYYQETILPLWQ